MVSLEKRTVTEAVRIYFLPYQAYSKIVDDRIMSFENGSDKGTIYSEIGLGSSTSTEVKLGTKAPVNNRNSLCSKFDSVYFYLDSVGVCYFTLDGSTRVLVPQASIAIKDYQSLDRTNILDIAIGDEDHIAFYDNSLNCIRFIQPAQ